MYRTKPPPESFRGLQNSSAQHSDNSGSFSSGHVGIGATHRHPDFPQINITSSFVVSKAGQACPVILGAPRSHWSWHTLPLISNLYQGKRSQEGCC